MKLLSEYKNLNKRAEVLYRPEKKDFVAILYRSDLDKEAYYFDTEDDADDFAEDWVLLNNE